MSEPTYLNNQFLIAMPGLMDPNFHQTVTYICSHNADGALGVVINRPLTLSLGELLEQLQIRLARSDDNFSALSSSKVFAGGPVQPEQGFVLHTPQQHQQWDASLKICDLIWLTTSRDILQAVGRAEGPEQFLLALGYAGWGAGQLERELAENAWLSGPADAVVIFDTPVEKRWAAAAALLGVDLALLSGDVGHA